MRCIPRSRPHVARGGARFATVLAAVLLLAGDRVSHAYVTAVYPTDACAVVDASAGRARLEVPILATGYAILDAIGFEVQFNSSAVQYAGLRPGRLTRSWYALEAQLIGRRIRVGGFDSEADSLSGTDTLAVLQFDVLPYGPSWIVLSGCIDDLAGANGGTARVTAAPPLPENGRITVAPPEAMQPSCYSTPDGTTLEVAVDVAGLSLNGVRGAEFRVEIWPPAPGATFVWTPAAGTASVGDPVDNSEAADDTSGVRISFPCRPPIEGRVVLGTLAVHGLDSPLELRVRAHNRPSPNYLCPMIRLCADCPRDAACVVPPRSDLLAFCANLNSPDCSLCTTGVEPSAWGEVKSLYR